MGGGASTSKSSEQKQDDAGDKKLESNSKFQKKNSKGPDQAVNYRSYAVIENGNPKHNIDKLSPRREKHSGNVAITVPSIVVASAAVAAVVPRRLFEPEDESYPGAVNG